MMALRELSRTNNETPRKAAGPVEEVCVFTVRIGRESFGLPIASVHTIFRIGRLTPVPLADPEILGLVNLRGKITTAISVHARLSQPAPEQLDDALAIGIDHRGSSFALIVDEVGDVLRIPETSRLPLPYGQDAHVGDALSTYFRLEDGLLAVIDVDSLVRLPTAKRNKAA
jgi:purine-binding chemotaxis protein CheW